MMRVMQNYTMMETAICGELCGGSAIVSLRLSIAQLDLRGYLRA